MSCICRFIFQISHFPQRKCQGFWHLRKGTWNLCKLIQLLCGPFFWYYVLKVTCFGFQLQSPPPPFHFCNLFVHSATVTRSDIWKNFECFALRCHVMSWWLRFICSTKILILHSKLVKHLINFADYFGGKSFSKHLFICITFLNTLKHIERCS